MSFQVETKEQVIGFYNQGLISFEIANAATYALDNNKPYTVVIQKRTAE